VRDFQAVIGRETRAQVQRAAGKLPNAVVACVGGGSNAAGIFKAFEHDRGVALIGVEAAGAGLATGRHAATLSLGHVGVFHGMRSLVLQDNDGQIRETHSISAGLDYPGVGPEHAHWKESGRATYITATDDEALAAFHDLTRLEGIVPALESAHAIAALPKLSSALGRRLARSSVAVVNVSGRGDKDLATVLAREAAP
jgi:tryptophan synthase beta chain